jgi:hypothetical protein
VKDSLFKKNLKKVVLLVAGRDLKISLRCTAVFRNQRKDPLEVPRVIESAFHGLKL